MVVAPVQAHADTDSARLLGVSTSDVFAEVIGGGQADFDKPWKHLSPDDRALLYAYLNQKRHVEELFHAFTMLFSASEIHNPILIDLGCGPFTAGLAFTAALTEGRRFSYIGVDRSESMCRLGARLAEAAARESGSSFIDLIWARSIAEVPWSNAQCWRPVIVIASFLLASPSLDVSQLVEELEILLTRIGRGPVTLLYTNAVGSNANRSFAAFRMALQDNDFRMIKDDIGRIEGTRTLELRYALFQRDTRDLLRF